MKKLLSMISVGLTAAVLLSAALIPVSALSAPRLKAVNVAKGVKLSWSKPKGAKKYVVSRRLASAKKSTKIKTLTASGFVDSKAEAGKKYVYTVKAVGGSGSAVSSRVAIVRLKAPTGVKLKKIKSENIEEYYDLTWKRSAGAKEYVIYCAKLTGSKTGKYKKYETTTGTTIQIWDKSDGNYYRFKVKAVSGSSESAFSSASGKFGALNGVSAIVSHTPDYKGVRISWYECEGAKGYKVYRAQGRKGKYSVIKKGAFKTVKLEGGFKQYYYDDKAVKDGVRYSYYVIAYSGSIASPREGGYGFDDVVYHAYDVGVQVGETYTNLSSLFTSARAIDSKATLTSEDPTIAGVDIAKKKDGSYEVKLIGITEGYTYLNLKVSDGLSSERLRVWVSPDPVYDIVMNVGDVEPFDALLMYEMMSGEGDEDVLTISVTSSDKSVVKILEPAKATAKMKALASGTAVVTVKLTLEYYDIKASDKATYRVKVK